MKISYPSEIHEIFNILYNNKYSGYIVGGCVRDALLGRIPYDWDICSDATPEEILGLFKAYRVIPTGIEHGTVTIIINNKSFEVTTYRIEEEYINNRKPKKVSYTKSLELDLGRRDFTMNAMAYNEKEGLIDLYNGVRDIENKVVRSVGNPIERFNEDALRILRGIRFATELDFEIEAKTKEAMIRRTEFLRNISKERIREEFSKILMSNKPSMGIRLLNKIGSVDHIIPELKDCVGFDQKNPMHDKSVYEHTLSVLDSVDRDLVLRLAALCHDIGKPGTFSIDPQGIGHFYGHHKASSDITEKIMKRLRYDKKIIESVKLLVHYHMHTFDIHTDISIKRLINKVGRENLQRLFNLKIADIKGSARPYDLNGISKFIERCELILHKKEPLAVKDLDISGKDLIDIGFKEGKFIGNTLRHLLDKVLENPDLNDKEKLLELAKEVINK